MKAAFYVAGGIVVAAAAFGALARRDGTAPAAPSAVVHEALPTFERLVATGDRAEATRAIAALTTASEAGDGAAQVTLGRAYLQGLPALPRAPERAAFWLTAAARNGSAEAATYLGTMSQSGEGVPQDPAAAARWLETAVARGSVRAMFLLANAYRNGIGVPRDDVRALRLYETAGDHEDAASLQALSLAYLQGELGLEPDEAESRRYAMEAAHAQAHLPSAK